MQGVEHSRSRSPACLPSRAVSCTLAAHVRARRLQLLAAPPRPPSRVQALGAEVQRLRPVSITHPDHFVNVARRRAAAAEDGNSLFADQFETPANFRAHLKTGGEGGQ